MSTNEPMTQNRPTVDNAMVERAAVVLRDRLRIDDMTGDDSPWGELPDSTRNPWLDDARAALNAALDVREEA